MITSYLESQLLECQPDGLLETQTHVVPSTRKITTDVLNPVIHISPLQNRRLIRDGLR